MRELMKIEIKKINVKTYILSEIFISLMLCFFMLVAMDSAKHGLAEPVMTYSTIIKAIATFTIDAYVIFGAVMIAKTVIEEYTNKTILILFSYPVHRGKMIRAKLLLIYMFLTIGVIIGNVLCISAVTFLDKKFDLLAGIFTIKDFLDAIIFLILAVFMTIIFVMLPYAVGIWKKSISVTVVTSIFSAFIVQVIMSQSRDLLQIATALLVCGSMIMAAAWYMSKRYLKNLECL